jgi:hypothetical protein
MPDSTRQGRQRLVHLQPDVYAALDAFREVASLVIADGEHVTMDSMVGLAVRRGLDALLRDVIGTAGEEVLLKSFEQLAQDSPAVVYRFIAARMRAGDVDFATFVNNWKRFVDSSNG